MESRLTYTYDNVNNRLTQVDNDGVVTTWLYDKAYQLLNERCDVETAPYNVTYTYDPAGNRLTEDDGDVVTTNTYDDANQLILKVKGSEVTTYTYDDCGNQTVKEAPDGDTHSTYDAANQATEIEPPSGLVEFVYNAMYQRVRKVVEGGAITKFIYDVKTLLAETDDSDDTTKSLTSGSSGAGGEYGDLISEYDPVNLTESYPSYDAQWSTRELLDENCELKASYRTRAFGLRSEASSPNWNEMSAGQWDNLSENGWNTLPVCDAGGSFGFGGNVGYYYDQETDLYLMGGGAQGRYYDPAVGRFTTQDPIGLSSGDPNLYRYVGNNPINRIDPSGNQEEDDQQETNDELAAVLTAMFESLAAEDRNFAIGWSAFKSEGGQIVVGEFWSDSSWRRVPDPIDRFSTIGIKVFVDASQIRKEGIGWGFEQAKLQLKKAILSVHVRFSAPVANAFEYANYELQRRAEAFQEACSQVHELLDNAKDGAELLVSLTPAGDLLMSVKDVAAAESEAERWTNITISILPGSNAFWQKLALYGGTALGGIAAVVMKTVGSARFLKHGDKWINIETFPYGDFLEKTLGVPKPTGMPDAHAHHILFKKGYTGGQQKLVEEGQAILMHYDIDPFLGKENLVWAPNIRGQHVTANLEEVVDGLRRLSSDASTTRDDIVVFLAAMGKKAAARR